MPQAAQIHEPKDIVQKAIELLEGPTCVKLDGLNGFGMHCYVIEMPNKLTLPTAQLFNSALRYGLSPENQLVFQDGLERSKAYFLKTPRETEHLPLDLMATHFNADTAPEKGNLKLYTNLEVSFVVAALKDCLSHPERGNDGRGEDVDRYLRFSGLLGAVNSLHLIQSDASTDLNNAMSRGDPDAIEAARAQFLRIDETAESLSRSAAKLNMYEFEALASMSKAISNIPNLDGWLTAA